MKCRITGENCKIFLNFGKMPLANGFLTKKNFKREYFFQLQLAFCNSLKLIQLAANPKPSKMFNKNYPFYTSSSKLMKKHFSNYANWIKKNFLNKNGNILEIGSNDGTFLKNFRNNFSIGFEPSKSVHDYAIKNKINSINKFFNKENIYYLKKKKIKFNVIVGSNVICHIPDQNNLIQAMDEILEEHGTIIFEEPYLGSMYNKTSYDQIYDEHIYMFSASSIQKIYELYGYKLIDAIPQKTHGGSMRYIIKRNKNQKISKRLIKILNYEKRSLISSFKGAIIFKKKVEKSKNNLINKINLIKKTGKSICGYGATSKSTTILNYCKIGPEFIDCIFDTTKEKVGKYSPGMHIPIVNSKHFKKKFYDYVYLFAWNHKKEILKKEKNYLNKGGKWISHVNL
jgi:SAM-dependent methyltransferase